MRVQELWRYPVKSLQGERLDEAIVTADGIDGDRRYAIFDHDTGHGLTGRRVPELLFASASLTADGGVSIILPDRTVADGDEALSDWLGRSVALRCAEENVGGRYEDVIDFEREQSSAWKTFDGAPGPFHDSPRARVSLASTDTIGAWDPRRFRANILLDGNREDALVGSKHRPRRRAPSHRRADPAVRDGHTAPAGRDRPRPRRVADDRARPRSPPRSRRARQPPWHRSRR